jgi:hypothetical protein
MKRLANILSTTALLLMIIGCGETKKINTSKSEITIEEARSIAKEAYVYGFPFVEGYKTLYKQAIDKGGSDFKAPFNQIGHARSVATPKDTWVVTPNSDTPYSFAWMDLRGEPVVITMPKIEKERYYTAQLIDLQTFNFAYLGTRAFGNEGGDFLIAGPRWKGEKPAGIKAVIRSETELVYSLFRTQLFNAADIENVNKIQDGIQVRMLSTYLGTSAPAAVPAVSWPELLDNMTESSKLFSYLNFLLQFSPTHDSETELMTRFEKLGIGAGKSFDTANFSSDVSEAIKSGIEDVWNKDFPELMKLVNAGKLTSGDLFGTREFLKNNYVYRFLAARLGLYGNSREEAFYPTYFVDAQNNKPDASKNDYLLRFEKGQLPPSAAFWSLTMYDGKSQLLVDNPINRYLLNSTMLNSFKYGDDGSLTLYLSKDSPGADKEANWLPAPNGPFYGMMRIYIPEPDVLNGTWKEPKLQVALKR